MKRHLLLLSILFCINDYAFALPSTIHCQQLAYVVKQGAITLKSSSQRLILIENISDDEIIIDKVQKNISASAGWATELAQNHYSVLAINQPNFSLKCLDKKDYSIVSCKSSIKICQINNIVIPKSSEGTYWVAENKDLTELPKAITQRGFNIK